MRSTVPPLLSVLGMIIMFPVVEFVTGWDIVPILQLGPVIPFASITLADSLSRLLRSAFVAGIVATIVWMVGFSSYKKLKQGDIQ